MVCNYYRLALKLVLPCLSVVTSLHCCIALHAHTKAVSVCVSDGYDMVCVGTVVKLWTIKTNECVSTFEDQHEGKIWAMSLTKDNKRLVTGGVDSILNVWHDVTSTELDEV